MGTKDPRLPLRPLSGKPELVEEWDHEKNSPLIPCEISLDSQTKVWWICKKNPQHTWQAMVITRALRKGACPRCRFSRRSFLTETNPELVEEWDYKKNTLNLATVSPHSRKIVWWICKKNPRHTWQARINNRAQGKSGCPDCRRHAWCAVNKRKPREMEFCPECNDYMNFGLGGVMCSECGFMLDGLE